MVRVAAIDPFETLMLEIQVVLPEASSAKARELYETMSRELAFNPRETER